MYYIQKTMYISAAHKLKLSYESKCENLHGHEWVITVYCKSEELNSDGMIIDFTHIKQTVQNTLDHHFINDVVPFNPTAENLAKWICELVPHCYKVDVQESRDNIATYVKDKRCNCENI